MGSVFEKRSRKGKRGSRQTEKRIRTSNNWCFYQWLLQPLRLESTWTSAAAAAAKSLQSCPTLCDPIDGSPRGSPVPGILQARTLEWVAISFSNAWKWKVKVKSLSCARLLVTPWTAAYQAGVGCHCLQRLDLWDTYKSSKNVFNVCMLKSSPTDFRLPNCWKLIQGTNSFQIYTNPVNALLSSTLRQIDIVSRNLATIFVNNYNS